MQARCLFPCLTVGLLDPNVEEDTTKVKVSYAAMRAKSMVAIPSTTEVEVTGESLPKVTRELMLEAALDQGTEA